MHRRGENRCKKILEVRLLCISKVGEKISGVCLNVTRLYYVKQPWRRGLRGGSDVRIHRYIDILVNKNVLQIF